MAKNSQCKDAFFDLNVDDSISWIYWFNLLMDLLVKTVDDLLFVLVGVGGMLVNEEWLETCECKDAFADYWTDVIIIQLNNKW